MGAIGLVRTRGSRASRRRAVRAALLQSSVIASHATSVERQPACVIDMRCITW
jgi:hypothetical protein